MDSAASLALPPSPISEFDGVSESTLRQASSPFDNPDADLILRTSDEMDFRVMKVVLALSSPFFKDMFTLPQPGSSDRRGTSLSPMGSESIPIVSITESSVVLDPLLRICYPVESPRLHQQDIALIGDVLGAALKYDIDVAISYTRVCLRKHLASCSGDAVAAYAIACQFKLDDEARFAAKEYLKLPSPGPAVPQLALLSGMDYYYLLDYHKKVSDAVVSLFRKAEFLHTALVNLSSSNHPCLSGATEPYEWTDGKSIPYLTHKWWQSSRSVLTDALKIAPLSNEIIALATIAPHLTTSGCDHCKNRALLNWEETKSKIESAIRKEVSKVELTLTWR
ncbi:hypothetical protein DFH11DRAFT_1618868 [Phellopilus nigrolimitatus]|nr:hypothetical protein DFH11DRAFT_1618868 [Phellopilus nigrolimitatus]